MQWRRCLREVCQRRGGLEIAVARDFQEDQSGRHLVWRVRLLDLSDDAIVVEQPTTLGQVIQLSPGIELVAILAIGQNRWMFSTTVLGRAEGAPGERREVGAVRLAMPRAVERCQRRNFYRVETASLVLPQVEIWPLLDPKSVLPAERANELQMERDHRRAENATGAPADAAAGDGGDLMPEVGPKFVATLLNIGGGGVGLEVSPNDSQALARHKLFWTRFALPPDLQTPICATAKIVHSHQQSNQHIYAGMAFDFSFNPGHQRYVVEQICRYIALQQKLQFQEQSDDEPMRRSA